MGEACTMGDSFRSSSSWSVGTVERLLPWDNGTLDDVREMTRMYHGDDSPQRYVA